jgi:hypothetical protein
MRFGIKSPVPASDHVAGHIAEPPDDVTVAPFLIFLPSTARDLCKADEQGKPDRAGSGPAGLNCDKRRSPIDTFPTGANPAIMAPERGELADQ